MQSPLQRVADDGDDALPDRRKPSRNRFGIPKIGDRRKSQDHFIKWMIGISGTLATAGIIGGVTMALQVEGLKAQYSSMEPTRKVVAEYARSADLYSHRISRLEARVDRLEARGYPFGSHDGPHPR